MVKELNKNKLDNTKVIWRFSGKRKKDGVKVYGSFPFVYEEGRECYHLAAFWRYVQQGYIDPNTVQQLN